MLFLFPVITVLQNIDFRQRAYFHCGGQGGANCLSPIYSDGWLQDQRIGMICLVPGNNYPLDIFKIDIITGDPVHSQALVHYCWHSRAPIVHTAVPRENNEHGCVYLRCRAVCKLPGCVEGHPWLFQIEFKIPLI